MNFGQQAFIYTPPSGYEALNTTNMPDPIIDPNEGEESRDYFDTFTYTGNGTGLQVGDVIRQPAVTGIIDKSLILDDGSNHYLSGTTGSADTTYTVSMWFKRSNITGAYMYLWSSGSNGIALHQTSDNFYVYAGSGVSAFGPAIEDSFWHHLVYSQSSGSYTFYLDGIQIGTGTGFTLSTTSGANHIGHYAGSGDYTFDGYIADVNFVSGTALNATSFGAFDANGVWSPIEPSVTYGSSGYRLQFEDATSTTTLGDDTSGNTNDFTLNNMATTDQVSDSPTNDFCVLDTNQTGITTSIVITEGGLRYQGVRAGIRGTFSAKKGKYYWEVDTIAAGGGANIDIAVADANHTIPASFSDKAIVYRSSNGNKLIDTAVSSYGATYTNGDTIGVALDLDNGTVQFYKNNAGQGTIPLNSIPGVTRWQPQVGSGGTTNNSFFSVNFGQRGFTYTPPTGFVALSGTTVTVEDQNLESPNWVWIKNRDATDDHKLFTTLRGVRKSLEPNEATDEAEELNTLVDFNKNGFTVGNDVTVNTDGEDYVAWCWANISESWSNDASATGIGDYDSSGIRGGKTGVSIFTYAGKGTGSSSIRNKFAHGLVDENGTAVIPELFWFKGLDTGSTYGEWFIQGNAFDDNGSGGGDILKLNTDAARINNAASTNTQWTNQWVELDYNRSANLNGTDNICFAFRSVEGFSKIGTYTGNESASAGPFIYTGFRPAWVMVKNISTTGSWIIHDNKRTPDNSFTTVDSLYANANNAESTDTTLRADFLSNGFVMYSGSNSYNNSGSLYLYMAFAQQPFKYANAR